MKYLALILCLFPAISLYSQRVYTLNDCIDHALQENVKVKRQKINVDKQAIQLETQKYSRFPDLNLDGTQRFDFGRSLNRDNTYNDVNSQAGSFSLNTEMLLFSGFKTTNTIAQQKLELNLNRELMEKTKNDIALQVMTCYYQILLNKEIAAIAKEQMTLTQEQEYMTKVLAEYGKVAESQVLTVRAQLANDELTFIKAENALRLSFVDLIQLLELRDTADFDIASIKISMEGARKAVNIVEAGYYPSLALAARINSGYYHYSNMENQVFGMQFKNNLQKTIYLTVRIPLFNRMNTRNSVRMAQKDLEDRKLASDDALKALYKDIQKTWYDASSACERYNSTIHSVKANEEALRYAKEKYQAGKSTVYEYNDAKMKLANSRSEQVQAKYEFALRKKVLDFYSGESIR